MVDEEITIVVNGDSSKADKVLDGVSAKVDGLKDKVESLSIDINLKGLEGGAAHSLAALSDSLAKISESLPALDGFAKAMENLGAGLEQLKDGIPQGAGSAMGGMIRDVADGAGDLDKVDVSKIRELTSAIGEVARAGTTGMANGLNGSSLESMKETLDGIASAASEAAKAGDGIAALGRGLNAIPEGLKKFASGGDWSGNIASLGKVLAGVKSSAEGMDGAAKTISLFGNGIYRLATGISRLSTSDVDGGVASLRSVVESFGGYGTEFQDSLKSVSSLTSAFSRLSNLGSEKSKFASNLASASAAIRDFVSTVEDVAGSGAFGGMGDFFAKIAESSKVARESAKGFTSFGKSLTLVSNGISGIASGQISGAASNLVDIARVSRLFGEAVKGSIGSVRSFARAFAQLSELGSASSTFGMDLANLSDALKYFMLSVNEALSDEQLERFERISEALKSASSAGRLAMKSMPKAVAEEAAPEQLEANQGFLDGIRGVFSDISDIASAIGGKIAVVVSAMKRIAPLAKSYLGAMAKVVNLPFEHLASKIKGISSAISRITSRVARFISYRMMRGLLNIVVQDFTAGLQNLYQWALIVGNSFVATMDSMATSAQYFKNSTVAAASGLLDAVAPVLDAIVDRVVAVINAINQLFAALSGAGIWRKAIKAQTNFADAADAAGGAAGGAKKAIDDYKNTVLDFDELHKLNDVNDRNGGGGGGGGAGNGIDYGGMFEEAPIDEFWLELARKWDWTELGSLIAEGLNSWEASIDWDSIDRAASMWSERIWTTFNGFISARDWSSLGTTVANGINTALHFVDGIVQNTDWSGLGSGLGESLNSTVSKLDWAALGRTLTDGLKISLETLHGFMAEFDFGALRDGITEGIDAAFANIDWNNAITDVVTGLAEVFATVAVTLGEMISNIDSVIQNYDWMSLGSDVAKRLSEAFENIDWDAVGRFITDGINVLMGLLAGFIQDFDWYSFGQDIGRFISEAVANIDWESFGSIISGIATGLVALIAGFMEETVLDPMWWVGVGENIGEAISDLIDGIDISGSMRKLGITLTNLVLDIIQNIIRTVNAIPIINRTFGPMLEEADAAIEGMKIDASRGGADIASKFADGLGSKNSMVSSKCVSIASMLSKSWEKSSASARVSGESVGTNYSTGISSKSASVGSAVSVLAKRVDTGLSSAAPKAKTSGQLVGTNYANGISGKLSAVNNAAASLKKKVSDNIASSNAYKWGQNVGDNFSSGIYSKRNDVGSSASSVASKVSTYLSSKNFSSYTWGRDIISNMVSGIESKYYVLDNVLNTTAWKIKNKIGFSEPKEGPLSDFHTYMPDMMELMASGIRSNMGIVVSEVETLAEAMRDAIPSEIDADIAVGGTYDIDGMRKAIMRASSQIDERDFKATAQATIANAVALGTVGTYGRGSSQPVELVIRVDGRDLARATYRGLDDLMASGVIDAQFV